MLDDYCHHCALVHLIESLLSQAVHEFGRSRTPLASDNRVKTTPPSECRRHWTPVITSAISFEGDTALNANIGVTLSVRDDTW